MLNDSTWRIEAWESGELMNTHQPVRVLFLAFGHSIHAQRRIQIFVDDPKFAVSVASTYPYIFPGVTTHVLSGTGDMEHLGFIGKLSFKIIYKVLKLFNKFLLPFNTNAEKLCSELKKYFEDYKMLSKVVAEVKPDVIFLQTLLYPCFLAYFLPSRIPIIITFWNGDLLWWAKWTGVERLLKKKIVTYGVKRAKAITVNSQAAADEALKHNIRSEKVHLIRYPGADMETFCPYSREEARQQMGIEAKHVVFCPRGLGEYLNSEIIVEAAALVLQNYPECLFIFLSGNAEQKKRHEELARNLDIEKNLLFLDPFSFQEMPLYYACSDVMVSVSSNDSLPNCMLEAMACKIPVIMGNIPQLHEWVEDGVNGYLVPVRDPVALADRIQCLLKNEGGIAGKLADASYVRVFQEFGNKRSIIRIKELVHAVGRDEVKECRT